ncbi:Acetyltransferase (GNAT) family protein [Streptomyces zhaozhouensis]|uniref:Acetyltransferase (GNAT) family protein n=1 Tax=Streptomyces zhaozhouensis TaxID=1300267 RepID=A0A286E0I3_9ACTN|nr:GNAT family N-acetyltransferase [Streptomyces zhaozhouensis]SOD64380.1 Acetyltransferase (GNAT) family protein [Streptomyces zhaozhouensis]
MIVVTPAAPAHAEEAVRVLVGAFREDPVMSVFFRGRPDEREARLGHLFRVTVRAGLAGGVVDLARDDRDGTLLGVAVWSAPGHRDAGGLQRLRDAGSYLRAFGPFGLWRARGFERVLHLARPGEAHWYLAAIGVRPAGRGLGVGSALLDGRLSTVDRAATAAPAYLEASTERSAALYERFGFLPTGRVEGFPPGARPIAMWRPGAHTGALARQG